MQKFVSRYNRFTDSFLIKVENFSFEAKEELRELLLYYQQTQDYSATALLYNSVHKTTLTAERVEQIVENIYQKKKRFELEAPTRKGPRTFKICNYNGFNRLVDMIRPIWTIMFVLTILFILLTYTTYRELIFDFDRKVLYKLDSILIIIPIYYFNRYIFTPIHEFGHYFFYYLFTKEKDIEMFVHFPGFMHFNAQTTTDYVVFIPQFWKRFLVYIGGLFFEALALCIVLVLFDPFLHAYSFFFQLLTLRIILSMIFNLNFLAKTTDGHKLMTDILGFPSLHETYQEWLSFRLNSKIRPKIPFTKKVNVLLFLFTILTTTFICVIMFVNLVFLNYISTNVIFPVVAGDIGVSVLYLFLMIINILFYVDGFVRVYRKKTVLQDAVKVIRYSERV